MDITPVIQQQATSSAVLVRQRRIDFRN